MALGLADGLLLDGLCLLSIEICPSHLIT